MERATPLLPYNAKGLGGREESGAKKGREAKAKLTRDERAAEVLGLPLTVDYIITCSMDRRAIIITSSYNHV